MLRFRTHLSSAISGASPLAADSFLHRLLLYSTTTKSSSSFIADDFLVTTCGLTPAQARKSSSYLAHLKSRSKPEAVVAFFAGIGLSKADIAAIIAKAPRLLCSSVSGTLAPSVAKLGDIGLSPPHISRLITIVPDILLKPLAASRLTFYLSFLGSYEKVHTALTRSRYFLSQDVERVVKPNIAFLKQCGLTDCDIVKLVLMTPRLVILQPERVKEIVSCADKIGVPRDSAMFKHALASIFSIQPGKITSRLDFLTKALGCSEAELRIAVRRLPNILNFSEDRMSRLLDFLKMEVGLEPNYIVERPALLGYSVTKRLVPRFFVLKALKAKGLVKKDIDFFGVVNRTDKTFSKRYLDPYKESVPGLADAYAAACAGQVPPEMQQ
ncbi:hypothetical protein EJB05_20063, partial [Eragrostis curvula]